MSEHANTTNTWACIKAIVNSNPKKAILNANGIKPKKKNNITLVVILYVKPHTIIIWFKKIYLFNFSLSFSNKLDL